MAHLGARAVCGLMCGFVWIATAEQGRAADPKPEQLRRGLVATYGSKVVRLEPTVALALRAGEAPHPQLAATGTTAEWKGYLNVLRNGTYRFSVRLRGEFALRIGGKEVLTASSTEAEPALKEGAEVSLEAGVHSFVALFKSKPGGGSRVELLWQGPGFRREPLPFDMVGHVPAEAPKALADDARADNGRLLFEELSCARCHRPDDNDRMAKGLKERPAPNLTLIGRRAHPAWIEHWLEAPQKVRPGAIMPELFSADEGGRTERYAVARYLSTLGGPVRSSAKPTKVKDFVTSVARGKKLFNTVGCIACHNPNGKADRPEGGPLYGAPANYPLGNLAARTTPGLLAEYLQNPLTFDPSGRMPNLNLQAAEALDLARYLSQADEPPGKPELGPAPPRGQMLAAFTRVEPRNEERTAFEKLTPVAAWLDLGQRLVIARGCNNCHTIEPEGKPFASVVANADLNDLKKPEHHAAGCLAEKPAARGKAPRFALKDEDRLALQAFLMKGLSGTGAPAPAFAARADLRRFNCLACHSRDGEGGLAPSVTDQLRRYENAENAEAVRPPPLTDVAHKLRTPWLRQVLTVSGRARPWMALRMPQFGEAQVGQLPEALAALEGTAPDATVHKAALDAATIDAGKLLVGTGGFGCISCHDLAGNPGPGTRGPDLAGMTQRVRHEWYQRWLEQPQRMVPQTRMPQVFLGGKSLFDKVYDGHAEPQGEAMWAYLSLGPTLPLPAGMAPPKGLVLTVQDRPVLVRTFMPEAGTRAMAVGFPGDVWTAFDAATCRLAYAWTSKSLDVSPVWEGRGGRPVVVKGARFWTAPPGCPLGVTSSIEPPDFAARAKDPAFGGPLPEGEVFRGRSLLRFTGYSLDKKGVPTFRYELATEKGPAAVTERAEPMRSAGSVGMGRTFTVDVPPGQAVWLNGGEAAREPRLLDGKAEPLPLAFKDGRADVPGAGHLVVLPQEGERVLVLALPSAPKGATWRLEQRGSGWVALLGVLPAEERATVTLKVLVWALPRDEAALLKALVK